MGRTGKPKPILCLDVESGEWTKYVDRYALMDSTPGLTLPMIDSCKFDNRLWNKRLFFCNEDQQQYLTEERIQQLKELGKLRTPIPKDARHAVPIFVYSHLSNSWGYFRTTFAAARAINVTVSVLEGRIRGGWLINGQYFAVKAYEGIELNSIEIPPMDHIIKPETKEDKEAMRERLGLYPYGPRWEAVSTEEGWRALMQKCIEEAEENNYNAYSKRLESKAFTDNRGKAVVKMDLEGTVLDEYSSAKEALEDNPNATNLREVCKGNNRTAGGFRWAYKEDIINKEDENELELEEQDLQFDY